MKITGITCKMVHVPYKGHYQTSAGRTKFIRRVLVFIDADGGKDNGGITGVGETGAILPERGGETVEGIYIAITKYFAPLIIGMDPFDIGLVIDKIEGAQMGRTGFLCSKCGIDNALYDIMGQATNRPVAQLLGGIHKSHFRVSRSLGVKPPAELAKDAIELKEAGYALITIKIGFDPKEDIDRVAAVRDAVGPHFPSKSMSTPPTTSKMRSRHYARCAPTTLKRSNNPTVVGHPRHERHPPCGQHSDHRRRVRLDAA